MRSAAFYSGILHAAVLAVLAFGLPSFVTPLDETVIPIELVALEDIDDQPVKEPPKPEPPPEPKAEEEAPEPEPAQKHAKLVPEPAAPEPKSEPVEPEPEPEPPKAEPEPAPLPEPEAKPEPKKEAAKPPPVPKRRPTLKMAEPKKKDPPKPKPDQLTSILRNVEKLKDQPRPAPEDKAAKGPEKGPVRPRVSVFEQNQMIQAIQQQLRACWRLDPGAREAEDLVVEIRVRLNPDGSVRQADVVDVVRMVQDSYFRSAAENAKRAIDVCSPFRLPIKKYDIWRELTLRFNPREMFGT